MSEKIDINQITLSLPTSAYAIDANQLLLTFQVKGQVEQTQAVKNESKEIKWEKNITLNFNQQDQLHIKLDGKNHEKKIHVVGATQSFKSLTKSGKHSIQLLSQKKQLLGSLTFHYTTEHIVQSKQSLLKPASQTNIKNQESSLKLDHTSEIKKDSTSPIKEHTKEPSSNINKSTSNAKETKKQFEHTLEKPSESQKSINLESEKNESQKKEQPKQVEVKLSERVGRKLTQMSHQRKPSEKTIEIEKSNNVNLDTSNPHDVSIIGSRSLNKSQNTFKLPNIGDVSKNFGDRIYDKQSSATLQKSILVFSMPKAQRFGSGAKYAGEPSYYVDSCFKPNTTKGVGFGFGSKRQFPEWMQKNMKENPAPGAYFEEGKLSTHLRSTKGPTFGISHKFYEKVTIPKQKSPERTTISNQRLKPILRSN